MNRCEKTATDQITAAIRVPPDSPWFHGHFPGEPILPGIAQLGMIFDAIQQVSKQRVTVTRISRVRFKRMVRPDELLSVVATPMKEQTGSYSFRITSEKELVCSGIMTLASYPSG